MDRISDSISRRSILRTAGAIGGLAEAAFAFPADAAVVYQSASSPNQEASPKYKIQFAVIGIDHNHILGITEAVRRGGGELAAVARSANAAAMTDFQRRYPNVKVADSEDEILNDESIQLVCSAAIPNLRAPLGVRVMRHGKDFLSDKPAMTTLEQVAEVRRAVKETGRIYGIMYSERLEVKSAVHAGELIKAGAIGKLVQTMNIAPHQVN